MSPYFVTTRRDLDRNIVLAKVLKKNVEENYLRSTCHRCDVRRPIKDSLVVLDFFVKDLYIAKTGLDETSAD